jgi:hypothetical protein
LKKRFEAIDQALTKNVELKTFRNIIENNPGLITELNSCRCSRYLSATCFSLMTVQFAH